MDAGNVRVICGPTAAGKTALALALAERYGLSVISADSRQIYRGFDIGTAKPSTEERERVPHYGIDVREPTERYSAGGFARDADAWLATEAELGRSVLIVGGTGFYIRALVDPLAESPEFDSARRRTLASALEEMSVTEIRRWCQQLDPTLAHTGRTQLLRAVETALLSGRRLSEFHASAERRPRFASYLVVDPGSVLGPRIEARIDSMLAAGWVEEVRALDQLVPSQAPAWTGSGYQFMRAVARGEMELERARELTVAATRQYAKRQRTWFRHQIADAQVTRLDPTAPDAMDRAISWFEANA